MCGIDDLFNFVCWDGFGWVYGFGGIMLIEFFVEYFWFFQRSWYIFVIWYIVRISLVVRRYNFEISIRYEIVKDYIVSNCFEVCGKVKLMLF